MLLGFPSCKSATQSETEWKSESNDEMTKKLSLSRHICDGGLLKCPALVRTGLT